MWFAPDHGDLGVKVRQDVTKIDPLPLFASIITGGPVELVVGENSGVVVLKDTPSFLLRPEHLRKKVLYFLIDFTR